MRTGWDWKYLKQKKVLSSIIKDKIHLFVFCCLLSFTIISIQRDSDECLCENWYLWAFYQSPSLFFIIADQYVATLATTIIQLITLTNSFYSSWVRWISAKHWHFKVSFMEFASVLFVATFFFSFVITEFSFCVISCEGENR